ncbi:cell adhesion molecule 2-like [Myripristis murdjan]|uniref:cell adhesion molecule 2-like n=1 Tax=Myripristis murdjan TaxID=586833 RepID=UPI00117612C6|nr:cell adhesion molecule 2-like [Myripristis murdjan]
MPTVVTSVLTFTASRIHNGQTISCSVIYSQQNGSALSTNKTLHVLSPPQILPSSGCIRAAAHINCSCETEGNPSPAVEWQMDGRPVNDSDAFTIRHEPLNATGLVRSFITINSQGKDLSTLVCHSTNSVGSARLQFCVPPLETSVENQGRVLLILLIATFAGFLAAVTLCALLFIRAQRSRHNPPKSHTTGGTSTAVVSQAVTSGEGSKVQTMPEEEIYINTKELRASPPSSAATISEASRTNLPSSEPHSAKGLGESSSDVLYSTVFWKSKKNLEKNKGGESHVTPPCGESYLEEERCTLRSGRRSVSKMEPLYAQMNSEYAQINPKNRNKMQK